MQITSFNVPGIHDAETAGRLAEVVRPVDGVNQVTFNVPARLLQVSYDESCIQPEELKSVIEGAGLRVQRYSDGDH